VDTSINHYIDLNAIKQELGIAAGDAGVDQILLRLIGNTSRYFDRHCDRFFYPRVMVRSFLIGETSGRLSVPDLLSVTSLTINGIAVAAADYYLVQSEEADAPYQAIWLPDGQFVAGDTVLIDGVWGYVEILETTGLTVTVDDSSVSLTLDPDQFSVGHTIKVEDEQMFIRAVGQTALVVKRGVNGTTPAAHAAKPVYLYRYPGPLVQATTMQVTRLYKGKDASFPDQVGVSQPQSFQQRVLYWEIAQELGGLTHGAKGFHA
jgi:hypothetical protein